MRRIRIFPIRLLLTTLVSVNLTACVTMINPPQEPFDGYVQQEKLRLKVGLRITKELRESKWEKNGFLIPIGGSLAKNSATLTRRVFVQVLDVDENAEAQDKSLDAILTPKLAYINRTQAPTSFGESIIALKVEWDLIDQDGKPIWIDTISGEGKGSTGWTNPEKVLKQALEQLLLNSQRAIVTSQAIRNVANNR